MAKKTDMGMEFSSAAYLHVPDASKSSTWKLRVEESPGKVTVAQLGRAAAALGKGFRGNKVQLSAEERAAALRKLRGHYRRMGVAMGDMPSVMQQSLYDVALASLRGTATALLENGAIPEEQRGQVTEDLSSLTESMYLYGLTAMQNGTLSFEAVCAALTSAIREYQQDPATEMADAPSCSIVATFPSTVVYEHEGKCYQIGYHVEGTTAVLEGEPVEVTAEFSLVKPVTTQESMALIEARPSGVINHAKINRALAVIEGTTLITGMSENGKNGKRRYPEAILKKIAGLAEGLPAYLNHTTPDMAFKPRPVQDLIGRHRNIRYDAATGSVKSDLHVAEHQVPLVFSLAEKFGDRIGNSLVSRGQIAMEGDTEVVQDILALRSADLVSDPASTTGLFESKGGDPAHGFATLIEELRQSMTHHQQGGDTVDLATILSHLKETPADQKLLAEHFGFVTKAEATTLGESVVTLTKAHDGLTVKLGEQTTLLEATNLALKAATAEVDGFKATAAITAKRVTLDEAITSHDLGKKYGKVEGVISDTFKSTLMEAEQKDWAALLDDRLASVSKVAGTVTLPLSEGKSPKWDGELPAGIHEKLAAAF